MEQMYARDTVIEVDLDAIVHNLKQFQQHIGSATQIMVVVKANGYGHGAIQVARAVLQAGASYLAVSFVDEGIELREAGITAPILVLSYTPIESLALALQYDLTLTVYTSDILYELQKVAEERKQCAKIHIKTDTGMGRLGLFPPFIVSFVQEALQLSHIEVEGLYTHYSTADERDKDYSHKQAQSFEAILHDLHVLGIHIPLSHIANSAASIEFTEPRFQMARIGIGLYGFYPSAEVRTDEVYLRPALKWKSKVIDCKNPPEGTGISYGKQFMTTGEETIATIPVGYADGYSRSLSNRGFVLIHGQRVPIVGRVCMDHFMVDVSRVQGVQVGDEVVLYGQQGEQTIHVDEIATMLQTINYEVTCRLNHRVPRIYLQNGEPIEVHNRLRHKQIYNLK